MPEFLFRDSPAFPINVVETQGSYVVDKSGKRYLDFLMGWCVGNAGWGKKQIAGAVKKFKGPTYVSPTYKYERWDALAEKLAAITGGNRVCFRATGGTEAVELALKIARVYNKRKKFIAFADAYHGQSYTAMALVNLHADKFGPYGDNHIHLSVDNWEETTQKAIKEIKTGEICAFISEPIICNLGVIVPPKSFFEQVQQACREAKTVFIIDEVATGFGRTGKMFGFQHFELEPDVVTMAKGISSGYGVIAATVAKSEIAESMRFNFSNYSTFGWHPLAVESALANIEYLEEKKLVSKAENRGKYLSNKLKQFCKPEGKGLCIGFDVSDEKDFKQKCREDGLLLDAFSNRAVLFPALDVSKSEIDAAVEIIKKHF